MKPIVIVGSGLAGYTLARELRKLNRDIPITVVSRDSGDFYSKPMLSNAFAQKKDAQTLVNTAAAEMEQQLDITLVPHCEVQSIDRHNQQLTTSIGIIGYQKLVLASGADAIRLPLQGNAAGAVLSINDLGDYAKFRALLSSAKHVAIMGGGLIGCEFANDLLLAGHQATIIDPSAYPLSGLLPEQAGKQLLEPLTKLGVQWRFGAAVKSVDQHAEGYRLTLTDDAVVNADVVLSAVGLRPRIALAQAAALTVNRGIVVDTQMRSSDAAIFALGDCAEIDGKVLPYVLPIMHAGRILARVLLGEDVRVIFPVMPVMVKTPAHPIAIMPVARNAQGGWQVLAEGDGVKMGFFDGDNQLRGFALTGEYANERAAMVKLMLAG